MAKTIVEKFKAHFPKTVYVTKKMIKDGSKYKHNSGHCIGALAVRKALGEDVKLLSTNNINSVSQRKGDPPTFYDIWSLNYGKVQLKYGGQVKLRSTDLRGNPINMMGIEKPRKVILTFD